MEQEGCDGAHLAPGAASATERPRGAVSYICAIHHLPRASAVPPGVAGDRGQLVARGPKSQPPGAGCGRWAQGAALCPCFCSMRWVQNVPGGCSEVLQALLSPAPSFPPSRGAGRAAAWVSRGCAGGHGLVSPPSGGATAAWAPRSAGPGLPSVTGAGAEMGSCEPLEASGSWTTFPVSVGRCCKMPALWDA